MHKLSIKLQDLEFAHAYTMQNGDEWFETKYFDWYRGPDYRDICFYTDRLLPGPLTNSKYHIALLLEPEVINPMSYEYIRSEHGKFDFVLTHHKNLIDQIPNGIWYRYGGCWIKEGDIGLRKKTKDLSIIISPKRQTEGHRLRHKIVDVYWDQFDLVLGGQHQYEYKYKALGDFRYQVVVENCRVPYYISEKLTDCFFTGTIPIYWGSRVPANMFNPLGMYNFNTLGELGEILRNICPEDYEKRSEAIKDNFERVQHWKISEDGIYEDFIYPTFYEGR
jgi:hypothetical protein